MFTRFDLTIGVVEPTRKGTGVYRQWSQYAAGYDVALAVAGNKVQTPGDVAFLREHAGDDLLTWFSHEPAVRAMEQGRPLALADLGPETRKGLDVLQDAVDTRVKDWATFTRQAVEFHLKNARAWANAAVGADLAAQVDPDFMIGAQATRA
jgi:CO dehydrogenase maturation factor